MSPITSPLLFPSHNRQALEATGLGRLLRPIGALLAMLLLTLGSAGFAAEAGGVGGAGNADGAAGGQDFHNHRLLIVPAAAHEMGDDGFRVLNQQTFAQQVGALAQVHQNLGVQSVRDLDRVGVQIIEFPEGTDMAAKLAAYRNDPRIASVEADSRVWAFNETIPNDPDWPLWGMVRIEAPRAWTIRHNAPNITVAVLDTGVDYTHPDLADNMWVRAGTSPGDPTRHGYNIRDPSRSPGPADANDRHGTHVAGTIGAVGNNDVGVVGVAWRTKLMAIKVLGPNGGTRSDVIAGINRAVTDGADIINASLGGGGEAGSAYIAAMDAVRSAGIIFVAAAGNDSINNDENNVWPANFSRTHNNVVTVAASNQGDTLAGFSNYGEEIVQLAAPGVGIRSTVPGGYASFQGTSMAAPHVAGAFAILKAQFPNSSHLGLINRVMRNVDKFEELDGLVKTGGRLNLFRALTDGSVVGGSPSASPNPVVLSPAPNPSGSTQVSFNVYDGETIEWTLHDGPPGATVNFVPGPNVAEPEIEFTQAGRYVFRVRVTPSSGSAVTRTLTVNVYWAPAQITAGPSATPDSHNADPGDASKTSALSVTAAYDGGEGLLTYTWTQVSGPENGVSFDPNGSNAAKNSTATFSLAGTYQLRVVVRDEVNRTVESGIVTVTVDPSGVELANNGEVTITLVGRVPEGTLQLQAVVDGNVEAVPLSGTNFEHQVVVPLGVTEITLRHRRRSNGSWTSRQIHIDRGAVAPTTQN